VIFHHDTLNIKSNLSIKKTNIKATPAISHNPAAQKPYLISGFFVFDHLTNLFEVKFPLH